MAMEIVAHFLQLQAIGRDQAVEKDLFGRASYNRYYYALFLSVRSMVRQMSPKWLELPHATYPELLNGKIRKALVEGRSQAARTQDQDLVTLLNSAIAASSELAKLMILGSATRVTADYHPEIPVEFVQNERFRLNSVEITQAHMWPQKANALIGTIQNAWSQL